MCRAVARAEPFPDRAIVANAEKMRLRLVLAVSTRNRQALGHGSAGATAWHVLSMKKADVPCEPALDVREPRPTKFYRPIASPIRRFAVSPFRHHTPPRHLSFVICHLSFMTLPWLGT
jgi:hypothetical protein